MRILVVEDDARLAQTIGRGLRELGFAVDTVGDGEEADAACATTDYDVVILDVLLPGDDGFTVCRRLRARGLAARILMLTALETVEDRVRGLDAGADDYLVKPFAFRELVARLRALSRRHLGGAGAVLEMGRLRFDTAAREVTVDSIEAGLTSKEAAILEMLMLHPNALLSRRQLEDHVWGHDDAPESNLVEVYIARIRQKLTRAGLAGAIVTVRGGGYKLDSRRCHATSAAPASA